MQATPTLDAQEVAEEADLGPFPNFLRPLVDRVARVKATVHIKLLVGFLTIAMLLLGLGVLSILVLNRVNNQVETLTTLHAQTDNARQMIYGVTAQSHFRAMALVTESPTWNDKILVAKDKFATDLSEIRSDGFEASDTTMGKLSTLNSRFELASSEVTAVYDTGDLDAALGLHIDSEHAISHDLEDTLNVFID
jgi:hypothetical protein